MNEVTPMSSPMAPKVVVTRVIAAPPSAVFAALTERAQLERWFFSRIHAADAKKGGAYRMTWKAAPGAKHADHDRFGAYLEVVPNERVVFEWRGEGLPSDPPTRVTITLAKEGTGTRLTLTHEGFPAELTSERDGHERGWTFYVDNLARFVTGGADERASFDQQTFSTVVVERVVNAPARVVFDAWASGEAMTRWWKNLRVAALDFSVGGRLRFEWESWDGYVEGAYTAIEPGRLVAFTWTAHPSDDGVGESHVAITMEPVGDKTRVKITHAQNWTAGDARSHTEGWTASLDDLEASFAS